MKRPKLMFLVMFWLFFVFSLVSRPIREFALQYAEPGGLIRPLVLLVLPFAVFALIFGLFKFYKWAINTSIILLALYAVILLANIFFWGISNVNTGIAVFGIEAFNVLSIVYLTKPSNRRYFIEFAKEKDQQKSMRKISKM